MSEPPVAEVVANSTMCYCLRRNRRHTRARSVFATDTPFSETYNRLRSFLREGANSLAEHKRGDEKYIRCDTTYSNRDCQENHSIAVRHRNPRAHTWNACLVTHRCVTNNRNSQRAEGGPDDKQLTSVFSEDAGKRCRKVNRKKKGQHESGTEGRRVIED